MSRRVGMGLVGPGFVCAHHIDAVRRLGFVDVVAVAASSDASAQAKARALGVPKASGTSAARRHCAGPKERQNELWIGARHQANQVMAKDPSLDVAR